MVRCGQQRLILAEVKGRHLLACANISIRERFEKSE